MRLTLQHFIDLGVTGTGGICRVVMPLGLHKFPAKVPRGDDRDVEPDFLLPKPPAICRSAGHIPVHGIDRSIHGTARHGKNASQFPGIPQGRYGQGTLPADRTGIYR